MDKAFQGATGIYTKALAPITGAETPADELPTTGIERPHELRLPTAKVPLTET